MADHILAETLRTALQGLADERQVAIVAVQDQESRVRTAQHNVEKAKERASWSARDAKDKTDKVETLLAHINSKPLEERSVFQSSLTKLQADQVNATRQRQEVDKIVREKENEYQQEKLTIEEKRAHLSELSKQISAIQADLEQALR